MRHGWLTAATALVAVPASAQTIRVGQRAPDFELTLIDKSKVPLSALRGQVVVLNFWATWCAPCKAELPLLDSYYAVQKKHGLAVFAVATEGSLPLYRLKPLFAKMTMPSARSISGPYAVQGGLPTNYIIDRAGIVRYAKSGAFDLDDLNRLIVPLLQERAPGA